MSNKKKKILICPMDWGLGHATRCIPVIKELLSRDCLVVVASSGSALNLLKLEFPAMKFYSLTPYAPVYSLSDSQVGVLLRQIPKFLATIKREHREVAAIIEKENIDAVISDNRYGCWSEKIPDVLITHQLNIQAPRFFHRLINVMIRRMVKRFSACWIPDFEGAPLTGELSTSPTLKTRFIAPLSRFKHSVSTREKIAVTAIVSGPEPQRTAFEDLMRKELLLFNQPAFLIRGLPDGQQIVHKDKLTEADHLSSEEMNAVLLTSALVISRPGYSTVMDLSTIGAKAVFVPTPGQTEQLYLGKMLMDRRIALCVSQTKFNLSDVLHQSKDYAGWEPGQENKLLDQAINELMQRMI